MSTAKFSISMRDHVSGEEARASEASEAGAIMILTALVMVTLAVIAALSLDIGNASQERRQAQNAADAASLAGAQDITSGDSSAANVITTIKNYVAKNYGQVSWAGCVDPLPLALLPDLGQSCISWDVAPPLTTRVRVSVPIRLLQPFFSGVAGQTSFAVTASAVANVGHPGSVVTAPCALCTLSDTNLQNGNITTTGSGTYVGGNLSCGPPGSITGPSTGVVGTIAPLCTSLTPTPTNVPAIADPLASLPAAPDYSGLTAQPDCYSGTAVPGIYNNIGGSCTLTAGLYVVTGGNGGTVGTVGGSSGTALTGLGVTVFLTCGDKTSPRRCNPGEAGATVTAGGNAAITLTACTTAPCVGGALAGMVLWFDRNNSSTTTINGNGAINFVGTIYGASQNLSIQGTPAGTAGVCLNGFCAEIVMSKVSFSGQGSLTIAYVPASNVVVTSPAVLAQLVR